MAQSMVRKTSSSNVAALQQSAREDFGVILDKLDSTLKSGTKLFPNGIELIKLTLKAGSNVEVSVVLAGKDAPKIDEVTLISESLDPSAKP